MFRPMAAPPAAPEGNALLAALLRMAPKSGPSFAEAIYVAPPARIGAARASIGFLTDVFILHCFYGAAAADGALRAAICSQAKVYSPNMAYRGARARSAAGTAQRRRRSDPGRLLGSNASRARPFGWLATWESSLSLGLFLLARLGAIPGAPIRLPETY